MGILETIKSFLAMRPESTGKENTMAEEKKLRQKPINTWKIICSLPPECSR